MAALEKLKLESPEVYSSATVTMGLSLGEFSSLCFSEALSFEDGVFLTMKRGEAMQYASDLTPSGMIAVTGITQPEVEQLLAEVNSLYAQESARDPAILIDSSLYKNDEKVLWIGNILSENMFSLSGTQWACQKVEELAAKYNVKSHTRLAVSGAFHTNLMLPARALLEDALSQVTFRSPKLPVISNFNGLPYQDKDLIRSNLLQQLVHPVQWAQTMSLMLSHESFAKKAYEIGPGNICKGIIKKINRRVDVSSVPAN